MLINHPLLEETPTEWKNIPIPMVNAIKNMIGVKIASDESLWDYQVKTNERLYKLQDQITKMKATVKTEMVSMNAKMVTQIDEIKTSQEQQYAVIVQGQSDEHKTVKKNEKAFQEYVDTQQLRINTLGRNHDDFIQ
jgi:hypothetical protein